MWEEEEDAYPTALPTYNNPLSHQDIITFLSSVKCQRKPKDIAKKCTHNLPGLVRQLKPLRNAPALHNSMQQRIKKLVKKLDS